MYDDQGERGRYIFAGTGAPADAEDLTLIAELATLLGTRRVGTSAQRKALETTWQFEGLDFWETDTKTGYRLVDGQWKIWTFDSLWQALPSLSGNYTAGAGAAYRYSVTDGKRELEARGTLTKKSGLGTVGSDGLFTFPPAQAPTLKQYWMPAYGPGIQGIGSVDTTGRVQVEGAPVAATTYVRLDMLRISLD